jgi:hypothetical protein
VIFFFQWIFTNYAYLEREKITLSLVGSLSKLDMTSLPGACNLSPGFHFDLLILEKISQFFFHHLKFLAIVMAAILDGG